LVPDLLVKLLFLIYLSKFNHSFMPLVGILCLDSSKNALCAQACLACLIYCRSIVGPAFKSSSLVVCQENPVIHRSLTSFTSLLRFSPTLVDQSATHVKLSEPF
jgi:hypothetical protein